MLQAHPTGGLGNAIRFQWRILQLPSSEEQPSYAGVKVEMLEQSDGQILVQHIGEEIDHQEAAPCSAH